MVKKTFHFASFFWKAWVSRRESTRTARLPGASRPAPAVARGDTRTAAEIFRSAGIPAESLVFRDRSFLNVPGPQAINAGLLRLYQNSAFHQFIATLAPLARGTEQWE
jgi:hypothetical protein